MMSIQFWYQNWVWQKWYQSCVNHRNTSLVIRVLSLILFWVSVKVFWSLLFYLFLLSVFHLCFRFITLILNCYLHWLSFSCLDDSEVYCLQPYSCTVAQQPSVERTIQWWTVCRVLPEDTSEAIELTRVQRVAALHWYIDSAVRNHIHLACTGGTLWEGNYRPHSPYSPSTWSRHPKVDVRGCDARCCPTGFGRLTSRGEWSNVALTIPPLFE
jgi:hypothetical protein